MPNRDFFTSRGTYVNCAIIAMLYTHSIGNQPYNTMVVFKMCDSVPSRVIPAFVMYCVNGASRSSLLIESTDSMILTNLHMYQHPKSISMDSSYKSSGFL